MYRRASIDTNSHAGSAAERLTHCDGDSDARATDEHADRNVHGDAECDTDAKSHADVHTCAADRNTNSHLDLYTVADRLAGRHTSDSGGCVGDFDQQQYRRPA